MTYLEPPYDEGSPWKVRRGDESAVVSERTAAYMVCLGVPVNSYGAPEGASPEVLRNVLDAEERGDITLSKKAQRLVRGA
jgi:hypothetical protein